MLLAAGATSNFTTTYDGEEVEAGITVGRMTLASFTVRALKDRDNNDTLLMNILIRMHNTDVSLIDGGMHPFLGEKYRRVNHTLNLYTRRMMSMSHVETVQEVVNHFFNSYMIFERPLRNPQDHLHGRDIVAGRPKNTEAEISHINLVSAPGVSADSFHMDFWEALDRQQFRLDRGWEDGTIKTVSDARFAQSITGVYALGDHVWPIPVEVSTFTHHGKTFDLRYPPAKKPPRQNRSSGKRGQR